MSTYTDQGGVTMEEVGLPGMEAVGAGAPHGDDVELLTGRNLAALITLPGVGEKRAVTLARRFGTWEAFLAATPDDLAAVLGVATAAKVAEVMPTSALHADLPEGVNVASIYDTAYPDRLRHIPDAPVLLWWQGTLPHGPSLAVVGTRTPSAFGKQVATLTASIAAQHRIATVSGLALGVDSLAHNATLDAGLPTWAVLGQGISTFPTHGDRADLARRILASGGGLLSEVPPATPVAVHLLTARNRIQSGLADAVFIAETSLATPLKPAGTLHTARFAIEQGRTLAVAAPPPNASPAPAVDPADAKAAVEALLGAADSLAGNRALVDPAGIDPTLLHITDPTLADAVSARQPTADRVIAHPNDVHDLCRHILNQHT